MSMNEQANETTSYSVSGSTLNYSNGDSAEFCVSRSNFTLRRASDREIGMQMKARRQ